MSESEEALVALLVDARRTRRPIARLPDSVVPPDEEAGYRVAARVADQTGCIVGAWKIGATALDNLRDLGAAQPICGRIPAASIHASPCRLRFDDLMTPVAECEFAFVLGRDMTAQPGGWTGDRVAACVAALHPAIEIGERRISRARPVPINALIADDSAAGQLVLGAAVAEWRRHDLAAAIVRYTCGEGEAKTGCGRDVLGHPLNALAWLAERRCIEGVPLRAGDIVTTGSCTGMTPVSKGSLHRADFGAMGNVEVRFE